MFPFEILTNVPQIKNPLRLRQTQTSYLSVVNMAAQAIVNSSSIKTVLKLQLLLDSEKTRSEINKFST